MSTNWGELIFSAFIGGLVTVGIFLFQQWHSRKRNKLERDSLFFDVQKKWDEFKREKIAEFETRIKEMEQQSEQNSIRYQKNVKHYLDQIQDNTTKILQQEKTINEQGKVIMELSEELHQFKQQVKNGNH